MHLYSFISHFIFYFSILTIELTTCIFECLNFYLHHRFHRLLLFPSSFTVDFIHLIIDGYFHFIFNPIIILHATHFNLFGYPITIIDRVHGILYKFHFNNTRYGLTVLHLNHIIAFSLF